MREAAIELLLRSARRADPEGAAYITVAGLLTSPSGIGEAARLSASTLADLGLSVGQIDLTGLFRLPSGEMMPRPRPGLVEGDAGGPVVLHLNPPDFQFSLLLQAIPRRSRRLIAYWVWELPTVPRAWRRAFRLANEVWVPTRFVADALIASGCRAPIRIVPYPVRVPSVAMPKERRSTLALRVLTIFAYDSGFDRKNPIASVMAFRQAFGDRPDVELVLKVRGKSATGEPERRFAAAIAGMNNVKVRDETMTREAYASLMADADVILSLHRSEGFGLVLAEAMLMGKPVVATAWSGNLDFMTDETACLVPATLVPMQDESVAYRGLRTNWADPSVAAAAVWLQRLEDPSLRKSIGDAARCHAAEFLGAERFGAAVTEALGLVAMPDTVRTQQPGRHRQRDRQSYQTFLEQPQGSDQPLIASDRE